MSQGPTIPASTKFDTNFSRKLKTDETIFSTLSDGVATMVAGTITNLVNGTDSQDAVNKAYVIGSSNPGGSINNIQFNDSGLFGGSNNLTYDSSTLTVNGTLTDGIASMSAGRVSNLVNPTDGQDIATKSYVDGFGGNSQLVNIVSDSNQTYTASQMVNSIIKRTQATSSLRDLSVTDTTASAADIVAASGSADTDFVLINDIIAPTSLATGSLPDLFSITLLPGSGVTFEENTPSILVSRSYILKAKLIIKNSTLGSEEVTMLIESLYNSTLSVPLMVPPNLSFPEPIFGGNTVSSNLVDVKINDNVLFPINTTSEITDIDYIYTSEDVKNSIIIRNPASESMDNIAVFYQTNEFYYAHIVIQNISSNTIMLYNGFDTTVVTGGSGYSSSSNVATTGGSGSGLTVNISTSSGVITTAEVVDYGSGYISGDVLTITGGTSGTIRLLLNAAGSVGTLGNIVSSIPGGYSLTIRTVDGVLVGLSEI